MPTNSMTVTRNWPTVIISERGRIGHLGADRGGDVAAVEGERVHASASLHLQPAPSPRPSQRAAEQRPARRSSRPAARWRRPRSSRQGRRSRSRTGCRPGRRTAARAARAAAQSGKKASGSTMPENTLTTGAASDVGAAVGHGAPTMMTLISRVIAADSSTMPTRRDGEQRRPRRGVGGGGRPQWPSPTSGSTHAGEGQHQRGARQHPGHRPGQRAGVPPGIGVDRPQPLVGHRAGADHLGDVRIGAPGQEGQEGLAEPGVGDRVGQAHRRVRRAAGVEGGEDQHPDRPEPALGREPRPAPRRGTAASAGTRPRERRAR